LKARLAEFLKIETAHLRNRVGWREAGKNAKLGMIIKKMLPP